MIVFNNKLIDVEDISLLDDDFISKGLELLITNKEESRKIEIKPISHVANNVDCECSLCSAIRRVNNLETVSIPLYEYEQMQQKIRSLTEDRATFSNHLNKIYNSLANKPDDPESRVYELMQENQKLKEEINKLQKDIASTETLISAFNNLKTLIVNLDRGVDNNVRLMENGETGLVLAKSDVYITKYDHLNNILNGFSIRYKHNEDLDVDDVVVYYPVKQLILDKIMRHLK